MVIAHSSDLIEGRYVRLDVVSTTGVAGCFFGEGSIGVGLPSTYSWIGNVRHASVGICITTLLPSGVGILIVTK